MCNFSIRDLSRILKDAEHVEDIDIYRQELVDALSILSIMMDFDQHNDAHPHDLWMHSLHTVINLPRDLKDEVVYLAALLHDIGKPSCITIKPGDSDYHYYGHPEMSYEIVRSSNIIEFMRGEKYSDRDIAKLLYYIRYHDYRISEKRKHLRKHLNFLTLEEFKTLMHLEIADAKDHNIKPIIQARIDVCTKWTTSYAEEVYKEILDETDKIPKLQQQLNSNRLSSYDILTGAL